MAGNEEVGKLAAAWLQQLLAGEADAGLTERLAVELAQAAPSSARQLLASLQMQEGGEADSLEELMALEDAGLVALGGQWPSFNLDFLQTAAPPSWAAGLVKTVLRQGAQWVQDAVDSLYIVLSPPTPLGPATVRSTRRSEEPLPSLAFSAGEGFDWDVEVSAQVESAEAQTCQIEVAVFRPQTVLEGVEVTIHYGDERRTGSTDAAGVVIFGGVPQATLNQAVVHVVAPET